MDPSFEIFGEAIAVTQNISAHTKKVKSLKANIPANCGRRKSGRNEVPNMDCTIYREKCTELFTGLEAKQGMYSESCIPSSLVPTAKKSYIFDSWPLW